MRRGANAVELGLTLPVFFALLSGVIDYSWYFFGMAMGELAAHRGCRAAATVDPVFGDPQGRATAVFDQWLAHVGRTCADGACVVHQEGDLPTLRLVCEVGWPTTPLVGLVPLPAEVRVVAGAHQEFQRY